jgi:hypothetical protein
VKARLAPVAGLLFAVSACQNTPEDYVLLHAHQDPVTLAAHISQRIGACWFAEGQAGFEGYSYAPELSSEKRPRVLVVEKGDPEGLPKLVIEVVKAKRGSDVKLFGPLMTGAGASAIYADVGRWAGGARDC